MKAVKALFLFAISMTFTCVASAQTYHYKLDGPFTAIKIFKVNVTSEMCKYRIETSIKSLPGVWSADWNVVSNTAVVKYDRSKTTSDKIELVTANDGQHRNMFMANEEVFTKLPVCCHYHRKS